MTHLLDRMRHIQHIHFIGIGGAGMGGIAEILLQEGYQISGSDKQSNAMTERLTTLGATVYLQHDAKHIQGANVIVVSTAIDESNPEIQAAREQRIPLVPRALMLAELMRFRYGIAIAGTHGKTTTTSLTASLLTEGKCDPTFVIGGKLNSSGTNAALGKSRYLVVEADESDASFLCLQPMISVITNIDADHMETYHGDFQHLKKTFIDFLHHLPFYGLAIVCIDDHNIQEIINDIARPTVTYGFDANADIQALDFVQTGMTSQFTVHHKLKQEKYSVQLNLAGRHNVLNTLASIAVASELGVTTKAIQKACAEFKGVGRRMQHHGTVQINRAKNITVVDDYGHHPRELAATFEALKNAYPTQRIVTVFQPHRYSRTRDLFEDFADVLANTDILLLLEVYSAGETPIAGADTRTLCGSIRQRKKADPIFVTHNNELNKTLEHVLQNNDILLLQGAGDIGNIAQQLMHSFGKSHE